MSAADPEAHRWVGPPLPRLQMAAILAVGVVGVLIPGLQPILLGALVDAHRLTAPQLGQTATIELLAMGLAAGAAGALLKPTRLRPVALFAAVALTLANVASRHVSGYEVMAARAAAGAAGGLLIWVVIGMIVRSPTPERWAGIYLSVQTLAQLGFAAALTRTIIPGSGVDGGFLALAGAGVAAALAVPLLPPRYAMLEVHGEAAGLPPARGIAALLAILLYLAFLACVYVYLGPLAQQAGLDAGVAGTAVSVSLAMQVVGGATAAFLAGRVPAVPALLCIGVLDLVALAGLANAHSAGPFIACAGLLGFLGLFVMAFQVPFTIAADPSRRAAMLIAGAQLFGSALGPLLASMAVSDADARGAMGVGAACIAAGFMFVLIVAIRPRRAAVAP